MPAATETEIMTLLFDRLALFTAYTIAWPQVTFVPPADSTGPLPYIAASFHPNRAIRRGIASDGFTQFRGILLVAVMWPNGAGEVQPRAVAAAVADLFPTDLVLRGASVRLRIMNRPDIVSIVPGDARMTVPITIEYEAFA